ncbi:MAG: hypothetical protein ACRD2L_05920 [Terriglobia bacterium]
MRVPRRTNDIFAFLFDSRSVPLLFILAALILAAMGNAFYDLLIDLIGQKTRGVLALIIASGFLLIAALVITLKALAHLFVRRTAPRIGESQAFSAKRRAIVFTAGKQSDTIEVCIAHQKPEYVGFICTSGSEQFADSAITSLGLDPDKCFKKIVNPWNVSEVRAKTSEILHALMDLGVQPADMAFDVTGGLTTMSVGVFIVAEEHRIDSQYVRSDYDERGKRLPNTEGAVFISRYTGAA